MSKRDFLSLLDFSIEELNYIIRRGREFRRMHEAGERYQPLIGKTGALVLQMNSTRTRVAFEAGMAQMGGDLITLNRADSQLGRGEPINDMAKVLSEMVDIVMVRTPDQKDVQTLADNATIPVINAMSSFLHPCQLLADIQAFEELRGPIQNRTVAFVGDGYNMCHSYINAARQWGFRLKIAAPEGYHPSAELLASTNNAEMVDTPQEAVDGADLVVTDVWSSMGHEGQESSRKETFSAYQINEALLDLADKDVLFMHCLPAHRGEEVSETLLEDPRSAVYHEAGNRLHSQKALIEFLLLGEVSS
ncbi:MAG: ornithine carbamoyltransferase [Pseudomonadales bacterium]